jgi:hypothetical protein
MRKYIALIRKFDMKSATKQFRINTIEARSQHDAWDKAEFDCCNQNEQAWVLSKEELNALKELLGGNYD